MRKSLFALSLAGALTSIEALNSAELLTSSLRSSGTGKICYKTVNDENSADWFS